MQKHVPQFCTNTKKAFVRCLKSVSPVYNSCNNWCKSVLVSSTKFSSLKMMARSFKFRSATIFINSCQYITVTDNTLPRSTNANCCSLNWCFDNAEPQYAEWIMVSWLKTQQRIFTSMKSPTLTARPKLTHVYYQEPMKRSLPVLLSQSSLLTPTDLNHIETLSSPSKDSRVWGLLLLPSSLSSHKT